MNYTPIHTNIFPSYNYMAAENAFLKQDVEYKNAVLCEQQATIDNLQKEIAKHEDVKSELDMLKIERDKYQMDARRWHVMKQIIRAQGNDQQLYEVQKIVDKELRK